MMAHLGSFHCPSGLFYNSFSCVKTARERLGEGVCGKGRKNAFDHFSNACLAFLTNRTPYVPVFHNLNQTCFLVVKITFVICLVRQVFTSPIRCKGKLAPAQKKNYLNFFVTALSVKDQDSLGVLATTTWNILVKQDKTSYSHPACQTWLLSPGAPLQALVHSRWGRLMFQR